MTKLAWLRTNEEKSEHLEKLQNLPKEFLLRRLILDLGYLTPEADLEGAFDGSVVEHDLKRRMANAALGLTPWAKPDPYTFTTLELLEEAERRS
jgi:hypothetical protein